MHPWEEQFSANMERFLADTLTHRYRLRDQLRLAINGAQRYELKKPYVVSV